MAWLLRLLWLVVVWVALWEDLSAGNVLAGLALGALLLVLFPTSGHPAVRVRPLAALRFLGYFAWKLVESSLIVAWEVVTPTNRISEGIVAVPLRGVSQGLTALVSNAISLTPGTLTLEARTDPTVIYVHVLHLRDPEAVRRELQHLEALAIRAFAPGDHAGLGDGPAVAEASQATLAATEDPDQ